MQEEKYWREEEGYMIKGVERRYMYNRDRLEERRYRREEEG
jgi:hypothetical protein